MIYEAKSLDDISKTLAQIAVREAKAAGRVNTQKGRTYHRGAEFAYKDAAQIVRQTRWAESQRLTTVELIGLACRLLDTHGAPGLAEKLKGFAARNIPDVPITPTLYKEEAP